MGMALFHPRKHRILIKLDGVDSRRTFAGSAVAYLPGHFLDPRKRKNPDKGNVSTETLVLLYYFHGPQKRTAHEDSSIFGLCRTQRHLIENKDQLANPQICPSIQTKIRNQEDGQMNQISQNCLIYDWDPRAMLSSLSFLEQEIHQLQELLHMIVGWRVRVSELSG
ncbi:hypothetical protein Nepgr_023647 [Nepenthes gracilis]|uniref:Uncharacterized protein n=1 Tax=Nepenthes gracilis TaxID=150966 RepID=A0AAD3T372_NEPGR|nr:hypothetical protein Nepgr_023647 [Nepenthes gracilis]